MGKFLLCLFATLGSFQVVAAQVTSQKGENSDKGEPLTVHVKEVHRVQDQNATKEGAWYHITAIVETKTIIYSLRCDEYLSTEKHDYALACFHLVAGKDYPARRFETAMNFWKLEDRDKGYTLAMYDIESEKEK